MSGSMGCALSVEPGWPGLQRSEAPEGDKTRTRRASAHPTLPETLAGDSRWSSPGHPSPTISDGRTTTLFLRARPGFGGTFAPRSLRPAHPRAHRPEVVEHQRQLVLGAHGRHEEETQEHFVGRLFAPRHFLRWRIGIERVLFGIIVRGFVIDSCPFR